MTIITNRDMPLIWRRYVSSNRHNSKQLRLKALEREVIALSKAILKGTDRVAFFENQIPRDALMSSSINNLLRGEGSDLRILLVGDEHIICGRINSERIYEDHEVYFFGEEELVSNLSIEVNAFADEATNSIGVRQKAIRGGLTYQIQLATLGEQVQIASSHLDIIRKFMSVYGIKSCQDLTPSLLEDFQELKFIHEKGHLNRAREGIFRMKHLFPVIDAIDEILSDIEILEHVAVKVGPDRAKKLYLYLLSESLTAFGGSMLVRGESDDLDGVAVSQVRHRFLVSILLNYFDSHDYQAGFIQKLRAIKSRLEKLTSDTGEELGQKFMDAVKETGSCQIVHPLVSLISHPHAFSQMVEPTQKIIEETQERLPSFRELVDFAPPYRIVAEKIQISERGVLILANPDPMPRLLPT